MIQKLKVGANEQRKTEYSETLRGTVGNPVTGRAVVCTKDVVNGRAVVCANGVVIGRAVVWKTPVVGTRDVDVAGLGFSKFSMHSSPAQGHAQTQTASVLTR